MSNVKTYEKIFANIKRAHNNSPIAAVFIQEHNIPQTETDKAIAAALQLTGRVPGTSSATQALSVPPLFWCD